MRKLITWSKANIFLILALLLVAFIPLYPKLPMIHVIRTWVYIRFEDVLVLLAGGALFVDMVRRRQLPQTPLTTPILWYFGVGLLCTLHALLIILPSNPHQFFPHLVILHYLRRIEYMLVFFVAFRGLVGKKNVWPLIITVSVTMFLILLYGAGQKFLGFPAFLTMNEEFAKGIPLRLPSTARIPSTFGGHYDLAAYLVFMIPFIGSLVIGTKKVWQKCLFFLLSVGGLIILLFTASRVSFGMYLVSISTMLFFHKKSWAILPVIIISVVIMNFTSGASERFYKTFRVSDVVVDLSTGKPIGTLDKLEGQSAVLQESESPATESLPKGSEFINIPTTPQTGASPQGTDIKTVAYYSNKSIATGSGEVATISGSFLIQKALVYDISITTRLQAEWPNAIKAFKRNILLGSGFSTLSVATDGDYFRMLGETGLLGTIAFLGIFAFAFAYFFRTKDRMDILPKSIVIGVFAGIIGLLCNAVLIDVFEASKVAYTLWLMLGFAMALMHAYDEKKPMSYFPFLKRMFTHPLAYMLYLVIAVFLLWGGTLSLYFLGDDFTWTRWAAESSWKTVLQYFTHAEGFFYRPIPKLWYFLVFSVFWLKPFSYHVASLILVSGIVLLVYRLLFLRGVKQWIAWGMALFFATLSVHHENIFWISGQSSLLAAISILGSMVLFLESAQYRGIRKVLFLGASIVLVYISMLCYDGMVVAPLLFWLVAVLSKKGKAFLPILLFIPLYWWMRTASGAVAPSGDYGYKWSTWLVNAAGNGIGYLWSIAIGPKALEYIALLRTQARSYILPITGISALVGISIAVLCYRFRNAWAHYREGGVWVGMAVISLLAYLGLGAATERYVFIASIFFVIGIGIWVSHLVEHHARVLAGFVGMCLVVCGIWNGMETQRLYGDWKKASEVAESSLLSIKKETFPPKYDQTFFIINPPIRYGRAWIFPTGLADALWHMFRENLHAVYIMPTVQDGFDYPYYKGERQVFVFEDYTIKRAVREEKTIEEGMPDETAAK